MSAQEFGYRERLGELLAGPPSLAIVTPMLSVGAGRDLTVMLVDGTCASLYASMRRNRYIEPPGQDPRHGDGGAMGNIQNVRGAGPKMRPAFGMLR